MKYVKKMVELARIEPATCRCERHIIPLNYNPVTNLFY